MSEQNQPMSEEAGEAEKVTSTVEVIGAITVRTYSDGAIQRNVWASEELAQEYAASVAKQEER